MDKERRTELKLAQRGMAILAIVMAVPARVSLSCSGSVLLRRLTGYGEPQPAGIHGSSRHVDEAGGVEVKGDGRVRDGCDVAV